jgi:AcrR family transcriptional regulator
MPRTEKQFEEIREQKISLIMHTALELFASEGYHTASISMIAKTAGISKGLMYNYFESKEDLILAIIGNGVNILTESLDYNRDGLLNEEEFEYFIDEIFRILQENPDYWKLYFSTMMQPAVYRLVTAKYPDFLPPLKKLIEEHFQRKGVADPEAEATCLDAMLDGIFLHYVLNPAEFPLERIKTIVLDRFR